MSAAEIIGQVLDACGQIRADGSDLVLTAPRPLPPALLDQIKAHKPELLAALVPPGPLRPLPPASEARRRKVLALARDGKQYAILVEDPSPDPVIAALATPDGTCELLIPKDRYDPFAIAATVAAWNQEEDL
jgi:hypothetical protein